MRNINELIGIIKGINFDGVINDKEIARLQSWVDKNRNLAYEPRQAELIKIVDLLLENRIIDEKEKVLLLEKSEKFLKQTSDGTTKIYELNGIIEGVICDGEVNEAAVYRLKEWMDDYGNDIREHKSSAELCKAIDNILKDGIVTEKEQIELLDMLNARINNLQLETKLDYLCKQVRNRKNIGIDLIDILDNEDVMQEIHSRAEKQLMRALSSYGSFMSNREIVVVSLVLIAMLEYDGNYYGSVRETYLNVYGRYSEQRVEGLIRSILSRYKKQTDSGSRSRIINVALENAIVPQAFLTAFFEFIFDIYKLNFEYDLPEEPYEDFKFVYEGLCCNMISGGDDISINVTQKTYKLIAATKQLIMCEDGLDAIIKLSMLIVQLIDRRFWDKEVKVSNAYLKVGYEGWEKQFKEISQSGYERRKRAVEWRSRWEPKFAIYSGSICLMPPVHRVKAQYDYREITVVVLNDGKEIYRNERCDIREIIGGYQVYTEKIVLERPLGKLIYRLIAGEEIIYDSKEKLYRNCIVFNSDGQEISNNTDYEGRAFFCYREGQAELENILTKEYYCIGCKLVRVGDAIEIGRDVFNFSAMIKPGIFGQLYPNCKIKSLINGQLYSVYKEANIVVFEAGNLSSKFEVVINGKSYKLNEMQYKATVREATTKYVVELGLTTSGPYTVEVNQLYGGKKIRIFSEVFVYDADLKYSAEMIDDYSYRVTIESSLLNEIIDMLLTVDKFTPEFIQFEYNEVKYNYYIPFDFGFYKLSDGDWRPLVEELWIDDIKMDTVLTIYDSECDELLVYTEDGSLTEDNIVLQDRGYHKQVPIYFLNSYKNGNKYVLLTFAAGGKVKYIIPCYNKCVLENDKTEILCVDVPKQVLITPVFHGKNKVFYEIFNSQDKKLYESKLLGCGQTDIVEDFNSFEKYTIRFYEKTKILQLRRNTLLLEINQTFYAKQDFVGRAFKIKEVYFNQIVRGDFVEKVWYFNKAYVRLTDVVDASEGVFKGEIFVKTIRGEWALDGINPVEVEMCSDVIDDTMDIYITNQGDGLLLDFEKHGILNSLNHPTAPDIFLYTISTKGEEIL